MQEYTVKENDFSEWDSNKDMGLDKVDRNGTHYYTSYKCPKCGGTGYLPYYEHVEGGICFLCNGTGRYGHTYKVMTEAYSKKLNARRMAKARKEAAQKNVKFLSEHGFNAEGTSWLVLGDTYQIKDELKAAGAKYSRRLGWAFPFEQDKYDTLRISADTEIDAMYSTWPEDYDEDLYTKPDHFTLITENGIGEYELDTGVDIERWLQDEKDKRAAEIKAARGQISDYVGEIGDKITVDVTIKKIAYYTTHYTYYGETSMIYRMEDRKGNLLVWRTGTGFPAEDIQAGTNLRIKGTIKAHNEYKAEKQTELSRVKALCIH